MLKALRTLVTNTHTHSEHSEIKRPLSSGVKLRLSSLCLVSIRLRGQFLKCNAMLFLPLMAGCSSPDWVLFQQLELHYDWQEDCFPFYCEQAYFRVVNFSWKKKLTVKLAQVSSNESNLWNKLKSTSGTEERGGGNKCRIYFPDSEICYVSVITRVPKQTVKGESHVSPCSLWSHMAHLCTSLPGWTRRSISGVTLQRSLLRRCVFTAVRYTHTHSHIHSKLPAKVSQYTQQRAELQGWRKVQQITN